MKLRRIGGQAAYQLKQPASRRGDLSDGAALHGDQPTRYAGYSASRAVVPFDANRALASETSGLDMRFGQVPLGDDRVYWFATQSVPAGQRIPGGERAELLRRFGGWHAPIPDLIAAADELATSSHQRRSSPCGPPAAYR